MASQSTIPDQGIVQPSFSRETSGSVPNRDPKLDGKQPDVKTDNTASSHAIATDAEKKKRIKGPDLLPPKHPPFKTGIAKPTQPALHPVPPPPTIGKPPEGSVHSNRARYIRASTTDSVGVSGLSPSPLSMRGAQNQSLSTSGRAGRSALRFPIASTTGPLSISPRTLGPPSQAGKLRSPPSAGSTDSILQDPAVAESEMRQKEQLLGFLSNHSTTLVPPSPSPAFSNMADIERLHALCGRPPMTLMNGVIREMAQASLRFKTVREMVNAVKVMVAIKTSGKPSSQLQPRSAGVLVRSSTTSSGFARPKGTSNGSRTASAVTTVNSRTKSSVNPLVSPKPNGMSLVTDDLNSRRGSLRRATSVGSSMSPSTPSSPSWSGRHTRDSSRRSSRCGSPPLGADFSAGSSPRLDEEQQKRDNAEAFGLFVAQYKGCIFTPKADPSLLEPHHGMLGVVRHDIRRLLEDVFLSGARFSSFAALVQALETRQAYRDALNSRIQLLLNHAPLFSSSELCGKASARTSLSSTGDLLSSGSVSIEDVAAFCNSLRTAGGNSSYDDDYNGCNAARVGGGRFGLPTPDGGGARYGCQGCIIHHLECFLAARRKFSSLNDLAHAIWRRSEVTGCRIVSCRFKTSSPTQYSVKDYVDVTDRAADLQLYWRVLSCGVEIPSLCTHLEALQSQASPVGYAAVSPISSQPSRPLALAIASQSTTHEPVTKLILKMEKRAKEDEAKWESIRQKNNKQKTNTDSSDSDDDVCMVRRGSTSSVHGTHDTQSVRGLGTPHRATTSPRIDETGDGPRPVYSRHVRSQSMEVGTSKKQVGSVLNLAVKRQQGAATDATQEIREQHRSSSIPRRPLQSE